MGIPCFPCLRIAEILGSGFLLALWSLDFVSLYTSNTQSKGSRVIYSGFVQAMMASEAQNKYERELMLHAADVEALQAIKEQVAKNAAVRQQLEEAAQKAESELLESKASWEERERMIKV